MSKISQSNNKENVFNSVYHRKEYRKKISKSAPKCISRQIFNRCDNKIIIFSISEFEIVISINFSYRNQYYLNLNHHDPFRNFNENELIHKSQKHIYQNNSSINVSYSLVENYRHENNVYCEKNQPRKHLNKRRPEDKVRNSSQKKNLSNSRKVASQKYHVKQEHQKFNLLLPSSNNVPSYTPSSPPQSYHIKQEHQEFILPLPSSDNVPSYTPSSPPQNYHIKQEHQKFILPLPSSDNVPLYSQNGSSSRIPIESLLNEFNCFPGIDEVAKEYCSTV